MINDTITISSSNDGEFNIFLFVGKNKIEIIRYGYFSQSRSFYFNGNEDTLLFYLVPNNIELGVYYVRADSIRNPLPPSNIEIRGAEISNIPKFIENDPIRVIHALPGVTQAGTDFATHIYVRGGNYDETLIEFDGAPLYNPYHFGGFFSMINADAIGTEQVYLSNYPVTYGGYLSGIVSMKTKTGDTKEYHGKVALGLPTVSAFVEGPVLSGSIMFSARRSYVDIAVGESSVPFAFYDFAGKYVFLQNNFVFTLSGVLSRDTYNPFTDQPFVTSTVEKKPTWGNNLVSSIVEYQFSRQTRFSIAGHLSQAILSASGHGRNISGEQKILSIHNNIFDYGIKTELSFALNDIEVLTGAELKNISLKYDWNIIWPGYSDLDELIFPKPAAMFDFAPATFHYRATSDFTSAYINATYYFVEKNKLIVGSRITNVAIQSKIIFLPYAALYFFPIDEYEVRIKYGKYFQPLYTYKEQKEFNTLFSPFTVFFLSGADSTLSTSHHISIGFNKSFSENITLDVEAYYKQRNNLSSSYLDPASQYRVENGYAFGIDIFLRKNSNLYDVWFGYSYLKSVKEHNGSEYYANADRKHNVKLYGSWLFSQHWRLNSTWTGASGVAYTPVIGKYVLENQSFFYGYDEGNPYVYAPIYGVKNSARYPQYHRLDIGVHGNYQWGSFTLEPFIEVFNVYNSANPVFESFGKEQRASNILPVIGVTIQR